MAKREGELTPLMKQYWDIKSLHQDKVLLFRMGDFYEIFYDDALKASPILGITLTQRNKKSEDQTPMCGFPHHSVAGPINKLLAAGYKVAVCDQVEDPATAKGIVRRAVTRILTPGMVYDSETLDHSKAHYLVSIGEGEISFVDSTTGEAFFYETNRIDEMLSLIDLLPVAEIVLAEDDLETIEKLKSENRWTISPFKRKSEANSQQRLIHYIKSLANEELAKLIRPFQKREFEHRLSISNTVIRHLELFANYRGEVQGSLFGAINRTKTSAGARLLRQWMSFPLRNKEEMIKRFDKLESFRNHMLELKKVREVLSGMGDIERRLSRIALPQCNARDLIAIADSVKAALASLSWCNFFHNGQRSWSDLQLVSEKILVQINPEAPISIKAGHLINKGVSKTLDELIELSTNANQLIQDLEAREKAAMGIASLKVRYNNVFGYYIEVTNTHKEKVPSSYQRKQTLANAERYCTDELIELEKKVLSAQVKRNELEFQIFEEIRSEVLSLSPELLALAQLCAELDVVSSLAWLSLEENYCRPEMAKSRVLKLADSRHAVVEQFARGQFVPNTIELNEEECLLLTGPNMAGKSTLMRQVALTVILAQMGSYVPAASAQLPIYDAVFTRIGASDQLSEGLSTFMVEMTETAQMLKSATINSLLILDEVGRGTATFDGMCLAQAILEYIVKEIRAHVFFATHYHELTELDSKFSTVKNAHMKVSEKSKGSIEFLHQLTTGPAGKSYGVQVAELAGLPESITKKASALLQQFENVPALAAPSNRAGINQSQMSLFDDWENLQHKKLLEELKKFSVSESSPLQAINKIAEWQKDLVN